MMVGIHATKRNGTAKAKIDFVFILIYMYTRRYVLFVREKYKMH